MTTITYELPQESYISLEVYNVNGQQVTSLASKGQKAGKYTVQWDGTDLNGQKVKNGSHQETSKSNSIHLEMHFESLCDATFL